MSENTLNIKSEDLNEAIRKAAAEHILKRQTLSSTSGQSSMTNPQQCIKSELERALDARLRRSSMISASNNDQSSIQLNTMATAQKNDLPPPPSPHSLHRLTSPDTSSISGGQPPPPPPLPSDLFKSVPNSNTNKQKPNLANSLKPSVHTYAQQSYGLNNVDVLANTSVRSIVNNIQISSSDPRLSSDFSALIGN